MADDKLSGREITDFNAYLANCTDDQVQGVIDKERKAGRDAYLALAMAERDRRTMDDFNYPGSRHHY